MRTLLLGILFAAFLPTSASLAGEPESCDFRIVDWNAGGSAPGENAGMDEHVAQTVADHVAMIDANVITLQEVTNDSLTFLTGLLPGWSCHPHLFGLDNIAVCVDGTATNFFAQSLTADPDKPDPDPPEFPWWGYVQVEYQGVLITSVHTRSFWRDHHRAELHADVQTGIVAGDFNHIDAADPGWYQTDLDLEPTFDGDYRGMLGQWKIDHILTVEEPEQVWGDATEEFFGSSHRVVLAAVTFPPQAPAVSARITNAAQPIDVDGSCVATVQFEITIHDNCCLDPDNLALKVMASNPTANATLGLVSLDSPVTVGPRDVEVTGRVAVSALQSCPAEVVIKASAQDCAGNAGDTAAQGTSASVNVRDTIRPQVSASHDDLYCLWPPNHKYVCFGAGQFNPAITDNCPANPTWTFDACTSNQPDDGSGDGTTSDDCVLDADAQGFCARSERTGRSAAGRRYDLAIKAMDACGNVSTSTDIGTIHVPHARPPALMCIAPP